MTATEWLIDNASAYERLLHAIGEARVSVWMTQLAFDADCIAHGASPDADIKLSEAILAAVTRAPVDVRIVVNSSFLLDTARPLRRFFDGRLAALGAARGAIHVRGISDFPRLLHAKVVIVDGTHGFLLGSPFVNGYWDDPQHAPADTRRPARELGGRPLHDVSVCVTGGAVGQLEGVFAEIWNGASVDLGSNRAGPQDDALIPGGAHHIPAGAIRVVTTSGRRLYRHRPLGSTGILDALLDGISRASDLLYVEHQYLSARPIVAALSAALERAPGLELIVVLNQNPDVTAYRTWQTDRLSDSGLLAHPRVGLFALWNSAPGATAGSPMRLNQVFVHSKVVTVDDQWGSVGSANLDGASLHSYGDDFSSRLGRRVFRHVRNLDVNLVLDETGSAGTGALRALRTRLWSEHLGMPATDAVTRPPGGWLSLWRARAAANVAALNRSPAAAGLRGFVLPYSARATPSAQLADLGVGIDPRRIHVCFDPGWLEVHCSPNWVRNMFP
ncbi:MAG: phospholipase D-like domain-containing protein [Vicinamibacterales bacterium]